MKNGIVLGTLAVLVLGAPLAVAWHSKPLTTAQVKQAIIRESIQNYPGVCACPYNVTRNGRRCGRRSAWSKPGGYSPKCYARDVTVQDVRRWRARHAQGWR